MAPGHLGLREVIGGSLEVSEVVGGHWGSEVIRGCGSDWETRVSGQSRVVGCHWGLRSLGVMGGVPGKSRSLRSLEGSLVVVRVTGSRGDLRSLGSWGALRNYWGSLRSLGGRVFWGCSSPLRFPLQAPCAQCCCSGSSSRASGLCPCSTSPGGCWTGTPPREVSPPDRGPAPTPPRIGVLPPAPFSPWSQASWRSPSPVPLP